MPIERNQESSTTPNSGYLASDYHFADYQEIKLNELFKTLAPGLIPRSICVILQNTLVESIKPGDDCMLTGILI